ncbi:hypothetical protein [Neobacillus niacini]|uniref:hypothetical protein n=1 Tax=Neobacillus niacini TaxID=86668 RepID=UPI0005F00024|nr:hypothetical protein [Neobacillus niacini]
MSTNIQELFIKMDALTLVQVHGHWLNELKARDMIRTRNVIGELGEYFALKHYNETLSLSDLQIMDIGTQGIDAIDLKGNRYSIKTVTSATTGVFNGLNDPDSKLPQEQKFEYVIIVILDNDFTLQAIYELNWKAFLNHKKWNKSKRTWHLTISESLKRDAKLLYKSHSCI